MEIAGQAVGQAIRDWPGNRTGESLHVVVTYADFQVTLCLLDIRRLGGDADGAGVGVLAVESALGALQHLNPLDVDQVGDAQTGTVEIDAIHESTH